MMWASGSIPQDVSLPVALGIMDGIHVLIGLVEGLISVAVVRFVLAARREAVLGSLGSDAVDLPKESAL
jgi:hypothetical protein